MPVNWCTSCKCVLANEEVVNGVCERCGSEVIRKEKSQWMLAITKYAQRLLDDLDDLDYIERVKTQQRNWIGRSTGAGGEICHHRRGRDGGVHHRPDTLFGATYMVMAPEACPGGKEGGQAHQPGRGPGLSGICRPEKRF